MNKLPKLDPRLALIASMVPSGARCADVGTDHGYLIAWLAASGKIPGGCACDINEKPLEKAAFSLSQYGVTSQVRLCLCDGLSGIRAGEVDEIIIAGMGGDLIWNILDDTPWTRDPALEFLLQPMSKGEHLRQALWEHGFEIQEEQAVEAGKFVYTILRVRYTGKPQRIGLYQAYVGALRRESSPAAKLYYERQARRIQKKILGMEQSAEGNQRLEPYQALLKQLEGRDSSADTGSV